MTPTTGDGTGAVAAGGGEVEVTSGPAEPGTAEPSDQRLRETKRVGAAGKLRPTPVSPAARSTGEVPGGPSGVVRSGAGRGQPLADTPAGRAAAAAATRVRPEDNRELVLIRTPEVVAETAPIEQAPPIDLAAVLADGLEPEPGSLRRPWSDARLGLALAVLVGSVHAIGAFIYPALADDEGTYVAQAMAVRGGELAHYTYWYDHPPLGWVTLAVLNWIPQTLFPGTHPVAASRAVTVLCTAISAALLFMLGRRLGMSRTFAAVAVLLAGLSPLAVTLGRQVNIDNLAMPWILASFVLAANRRRHLGLHIAAGLCFAMAVLTKETSLIVLPGLVWLLVQHSHPRTRAFSIVGLLGALGLVVAFYPLMAVLRGELLPGQGHVSLLGAIAFQLVDRTGSGAIWQAGSASGAIVDGWLYYDHWLILAGLIALPVALAVRRVRPAAVALLALVAMALKPNGYLPAMYVVAAIPFLGLAVAGVLDAAWQALSAPDRARAFGRWVLTLAGCVAVMLLATSWTPRLAQAATSRQNQDRIAAEGWLEANVPAGSVVLTDDVSWVELIRSGAVGRRKAIWFYKLDSDPAIAARYPHGWRDVDYVLSTDQMRRAVTGDRSLVQSARALRGSRVVASFGSGGTVVQVRAVIDQRVREVPDGHRPGQ
jgi:4-amino-4-deoxy-L-arabinose transferase-like glycosyltransferase